MRLTLRNAATAIAGIALTLTVIRSGRVDVLCIFFSAISSIPLVLIASQWVAAGPSGRRSAFDTASLVILYLLITRGTGDRNDYIRRQLREWGRPLGGFHAQR